MTTSVKAMSASVLDELLKVRCSLLLVPLVIMQEE